MSWIFPITVWVLTEEIGAFTGLIRFKASGNNYQSMPATIGRCTAIEELDLHDNKLHVLPAEFGELINCKKMDVSNNQLAKLPWELGRLTSPPLTILNVKSNPLLVPPGGVVNKGTPTILMWLRKNEKDAGGKAVSGLEYSDTDSHPKGTV